MFPWLRRKIPVFISALVLSGAVWAASPPDSKSVHDAALGLLQHWVDVQNQGDAAGYFALYDPHSFKGIKRTHDGKVTAYGLAAWKTDRERLFTQHPTVAAVSPQVATWLDVGVKLQPGVVAVRFTQRWKIGSTASHGTKVMHLWYRPDGKAQIIYEDLLDSAPGWESTVSTASVSDHLTPPHTEEEAITLWRKLGPTGANYESVVQALAKNPEVSVPMARAIVASGNVGCDEVVAYSECGGEFEEWKELRPEADFDDPCLRRRLALWSVTSAGLKEKDFQDLQAQFSTWFQLRSAEKELPDALMKATAGFKEAQRLEWVAAAANNGHKELAEAGVAGMSEPSMAKAYEIWHLDTAAHGLTVGAHLPLLLAAVADTDLASETRLDILDKLAAVRKPAMTEVLRGLAQNDDICPLAMKAAALLAERGDKHFLPKPPRSVDPEAYGQALCLLASDPDPERKAKTLKLFLPARGDVKVTSSESTGEPEGNAEKKAVLPAISRQTASVFDLPAELSQDSWSCDAETEPSCSASMGGDYGVNYFFSFQKSQGRLFLKEIEVVHDFQCGC